ncbi:hypothetical protein XENOCAPTIV_011557 [Xenoophorus captivus]|uniref:Uncharacterized protein n=1 Tax=Xenoophorus captivus TaxID=1517983 RepID=A0ABV0QZW1_9TELE
MPFILCQFSSGSGSKKHFIYVIRDTASSWGIYNQIVHRIHKQQTILHFGCKVFFEDVFYLASEIKTYTRVSSPMLGLLQAKGKNSAVLLLYGPVYTTYLVKTEKFSCVSNIVDFRRTYHQLMVWRGNCIIFTSLLSLCERRL